MDSITRYNEVDTRLATATTVQEANDVLRVLKVMRQATKEMKRGAEERAEAERRACKAESKVAILLTQLERGAGPGRGNNKTSDSVSDVLSEYTQVLQDEDIHERMARRLQNEWAGDIDAIEQIGVDESIAMIHEEIDNAIDSLLMDGKAVSKSAILKEITPNVHVSQNSGENEWYTPSDLIERARSAMGEIDLDPASSDIANETVKAGVYYGEGENGLLQEWRGRVWMNPPYAQPLITQFCKKLQDEFTNGNVTEAIVLVNNATETAWFDHLVSVSCAIIFPARRVRFKTASGVPGGPLQGQAILYMGDAPEHFFIAFDGVGWGCEIVTR